MIIVQALTKSRLAVVLATLVLWSGLCSARPVLIHNASLQQVDLSTDSLVRIYAMQKRSWSNGTPVRVYTLANDSELHQTFVRDFLRMQPYQLDRLWYRLVFSGTGSTPQQTSSQEEMLEKVRTTPGAIGYVDSSFIERINASEITVVNHD